MAYNKADFLAGIAAGRNMQSWPVMEQNLELFITMIEVGSTAHPSLTYDSRNLRTNPSIQPSSGIVLWGDGTQSVIPADLMWHTMSHTYATAGIYTVVYSGITDWDGGYVGSAETALIAVLTPFPKGVQWMYPFRDCRNLVSIPDDLFKNFDPSIYTEILPTQVMSRAFRNCFALENIPEHLLDPLTGITSMGETFYQCRALTSIPANLFANRQEITSFGATFSDCKGLTAIPSGLFNGCPNADYFIRCFDACTAITSAVPDLWNQYPAASGSGCFRQCINAANYSSIPSGWR